MNYGHIGYIFSDLHLLFQNTTKGHNLCCPFIKGRCPAYCDSTKASNQKYKIFTKGQNLHGHLLSGCWVKKAGKLDDKTIVPDFENCLGRMHTLAYFYYENFYGDKVKQCIASHKGDKNKKMHVKIAQGSKITLL